MFDVNGIKLLANRFSAKKILSAKSLILGYLTTSVSTSTCFTSKFKIEAAPPSGYTQLDLVDPEQSALAILKTQQSKWLHTAWRN